MSFCIKFLRRCLFCIAVLMLVFAFFGCSDDTYDREGGGAKGDAVYGSSNYGEARFF